MSGLLQTDASGNEALHPLKTEPDTFVEVGRGLLPLEVELTGRLRPIVAASIETLKNKRRDDVVDGYLTVPSACVCLWEGE
ncbi:MAG: hypothetical protein JSW71_04265 [Gemmatimonadota bacterium]|nr:MAG: hypothetical protein JSW71_04265 [Gemmatimonadota bacterium]